MAGLCWLAIAVHVLDLQMEVACCCFSNQILKMSSISFMTFVFSLIAASTFLWTFRVDVFILISILSTVASSHCSGRSRLTEITQTSTKRRAEKQCVRRTTKVFAVCHVNLHSFTGNCKWQTHVPDRPTLSLLQNCVYRWHIGTQMSRFLHVNSGTV